MPAKGISNAPFYAHMAFSVHPGSGSLTKSFNAYGDMSYLSSYRKRLGALVNKSRIVSINELDAMAGGLNPEDVFAPDKPLVVPFSETPSLYKQLATLNILPEIETDFTRQGQLRSDYFGALAFPNLIFIHRRGALRTLLPQREQQGLEEPDNIVYRVGEARKNCYDVCADRNERCIARAVRSLNSCRVLRDYFPCEMQCARVDQYTYGTTMPGYVVSWWDPHHGYCIVVQGRGVMDEDDDVDMCEHANGHVQRLCPCVHEEWIVDHDSL